MIPNKISLLIMICLVLSSLTGQILAQDDDVTDRDDETYIGVVTRDGDEIPYVIMLIEGDGIIITAVATRGSELDPYLILTDPAGDTVAENDDYEYPQSVNSQIEYIAEKTGEHTIYVTNYPNTIGEFELTIEYVLAEEIGSSSDDDVASGSSSGSDQDEDEDGDSATSSVDGGGVSAQSQGGIGGEDLSGEVQITDTENFRIYYTFEGVDATTPRFVQFVATAVEETYDIQINQLGWAPPPRAVADDGDDRIGVYILQIDDYLGFIDGSSPGGDNPFTEVVEESSRAKYIVIDNDFSEYGNGTPIGVMRATVAHEFHHVVQFGYDSDESGEFSWIYEAAASWMETVTFPTQEDATGYVPDGLEFPHICLGGQGRAAASSLSIYGAWLFFEYMATTLEAEAPIRWWENIVTYDGWDSLEVTVEAYDYTLTDFVAGYHINNLVRDYLFVSDFASTTVPMEEFINATGNWTPSGAGVQELAANYYEFRPSPGVYEIALDTSNTDLELYAVGIIGDRGEVFSVGTDGAIINSNLYNYVYLMVFNTDYDNNLNDCDFEDYSLTVSVSDGTVSEPDMMVDASQFRRLR